MKTAIQFAAFTAVSVLSFLIDLGVFTIAWKLLPGNFPARLFAAVSVARVLSLAVNYGLNRQVIFRREKSASPGTGPATHAVKSASRFTSRSFPRYMALAAVIMVASWLGLKAVHAVFQDFPLPLAKPIIDALLFVCSFMAQKRFVFASRQR